MPSPLTRATQRAARAVAELTFAPPVAFVYNPLDYAWRPHARYLERFGGGTKQFLLLGMNPGPFGMAQTGVPFGEVAAVRDFLGIEEPVGAPRAVHPKRPIHGFGCSRSEVSGKRLWGLVQRCFGAPERFFAQGFVHNYCPLVFMDEGGRNLTPDKLPAAERTALFAVCDELLGAVVRALKPGCVLGVGVFAEQRARHVLGGTGVGLGRIPHPSPASPAANRGWDEAALRA
ncbi:MAG: single-stranded DNA-binding protein, partial [Planctomycetes bacterium]|nr:single-stranded DNA-binding protein [Planctomycetota bacterium]